MPRRYVTDAIVLSRFDLGEADRVLTLITPEHGIHVLEVMNACHESQRTGRRVALESSFKWPLFG